MQQPTDVHSTAKDLSSGELKEYNAHFNRQFKNWKVDKALLQRAWYTAHRIAAMLYEDFEATKVAVFGSLATQSSFSKWSDIDIAVWGIPNDRFFRASSRVSDISGLFKVDIIDFENCKGLFRERIKSQLTIIEKGVIFKVDRSGLIQRILDEQILIEETIGKIVERLEKIKTAPIEYREEIETTIAKNLVDCYRGMETIFREIALDVDLHIPDGNRWHKELLTQMSEPQTDRGPVISQESLEQLQELLEFRHVFNYIYGQKLLFDKTEKVAIKIELLFNIISKELDTFIDFLNQQ